jgi:transmembrane sensor
MNSNEQFDYLLDRYLSEKITPEEKEQFFNLLITSDYDDKLDAHILTSLQNTPVTENAGMPGRASEEIIQTILQSSGNFIETIPEKPSRRLFFRLSTAAAVVLALTAGLFLLLNNKEEQNYFAAQVEQMQFRQLNESDTLQLLVMNDGSRVTLHPGASLYYPSQFSDTLREVYMEGDAFFEVSPDVTKPFLVHSRHITTRVLGTSFLIRMDPQTGVEEVAVKTGRVQVSENIRALNKPSEDVPAVILTPNQKAIYETGKRVLFATLVASPQVVVKESETPVEAVKQISFKYEHQKLSDIFRELETAYGIEINLENVALGNCLFTGDLSDNDLFTQLKIICLTTQSSYELKGTEILMKGNGCH